MNRTLRLALVLLGSATALTACDYTYSPGVNSQYKANFNWTPTWHTSDVHRDSINNRENVKAPSGVGSAADLKKGGAKADLNSAPAGNSATSPQDASGKLANPASQSTSGKGNSASSDQPK